MDEEIRKLNERAQGYSEKLGSVQRELAKVIVGQARIVEKLMIALISDGHVLLEGVPGLAKTLMIRSLADSINASFCRIQFTPDLLPADLIGTKIYNHKEFKFTTKKGPVFSNFILADEINRAPPKVQSALLEAMQERQVTISGDTFTLDKPFLVMATQNPIETEGTYRLPEAQVDRFMFKLLISYPSKQEEERIISLNTEGSEEKVSKVIAGKEILEMQAFVRRIYADDKVKGYVTSIVDATRNPKSYGLEMARLIDYGASPRASIWLILASKAQALLQGRGYVLPEDVQYVCHDILRHRILTSYEAEAEEIESDNIIDSIMERVKVP